MGENRSTKLKSGKSKGKLKKLTWENMRIGSKYLNVYLLTSFLFLLAGILVYFELNKGQL